ncbi:hypothetical protein BBC0122_005860 [Bartonella choladocola]|uniref:Uncharacterized protein n=1 Tax=Bartonella choladocola TaxID=2750995 RepID=A0A1U9MFK8_9HYPH|nr:hypothetical protein BBC0122_005860 [Bartonella choladocola]
MARPDRSHNWASRLSPSLNELDSIARNSFANLPSKFRVLCDDLIISVTDFPDDQMMDDMGLESPSSFWDCLKGRELVNVFRSIQVTRRTG